MRPPDPNRFVKHLHRLWRFDVHLESIHDGKARHVYHCNDKKVWTDADEKKN